MGAYLKKNMPIKVSKIDGKYRMSSPTGNNGTGPTRQQAARQTTLIRAIDNGWKPEEDEIREQAAKVVNGLLEVDEIGSVPIPASGKAYARLHGMRGLQRKQQLFIDTARDLGNRGKPTEGFKNRDGAEYTGHKDGHKDEGMDNAPVASALERSHVEKTVMGGGKYGKHVDPKHKTSGKFKFPSNYKVGHAIKS